MLCRQCGRELEEGRKFCTFCGAEQEPEGAAGGMSTVTKIIIGVVAVLVLAGAGIGIYFGVRSTSSSESETTQSSTEGRKIVIPQVRSEKLAYIDNKDIYAIALNGTAQQKITSRGDIVDFAVAPDGSRIAFVAATGTVNQSIIFMMRPDGSDLQQVTLPEKGFVENPAFGPTGKYIYFTRVTPEDQANIEAARPYGVGFERYDIAENEVDHLYTYSGLQEQSIVGLYADPTGGDIYFNLFGSDWPSSVPHRLSLGPPVSESVYMPMQTDTGKYTAVAFQLTGFSRNGANVSYFKQALLEEQDQNVGPTQEVSACFKRTGGGGETEVATYTPTDMRNGEVSGMEFSRVENAKYYFSKVRSTGPDASSLTLEFYKGTGGSSAPTGLDVSISVEAQEWTPLAWHLLPVK
jgi:hypothetical protein